MSGFSVFPFTAIVGQEKAKLALLCNAVNPAIGGVLLSGDRGCGKSTMVRALADVLPEIEVVDGCPFNCDPRGDKCDECLKKERKGELRVVRRKMKVVDLPLSVSVDRLVGTIDLEKAFKGVRALQPGILAEANRNILYIDEVNLLDDYIADTLLDAAAMGWNVVEREGVSVRHPSRFILVGSMNPEEGELRPQILDRFGLFVKVEAIRDVEERMEILRRVEEFQSDPLAFRKKYEGKQKELREKIERARRILPEVAVEDELVRFIVKTVVDMGIRTHRAEVVTLRTAKAIAALDGRREVSLEDVKRAMELSLVHRSQEVSFSFSSNPKQSSHKSGKQEMPEKSKIKPESKSKSNNSKNEKIGDNSVNDNQNLNVNIKIKEGKQESIKTASRGSRGARKTSVVGEGIHIYSIPGEAKEGVSIDVIGTLKARCFNSGTMVKVKRVRVPRLAIIVLDASGSMLASRRVAVAKAVAKSLIKNSYVKRDFLSLIVFRGTSAKVVVKPTKKYSDVLNALENVEVGGRTPLPSALRAVSNLAVNFRGAVKAVLITDGKANVSSGGKIREEVVEELKKLKKSKVKLEVYDTRHGFDPAPSFIETMREFGVEVSKVK